MDERLSPGFLRVRNPTVFPGYWSVCADGRGYGYGNWHPSLGGHQITDALVWLGRVDVAIGNFDYVKKFQREDGNLPLAILPLQNADVIYRRTLDRE